MDVLKALWPALALGLLSSGHCALMCGPLQQVWAGKARSPIYLVYQLGRLLSYTIIAYTFWHLGTMVQFRSSMSHLGVLTGSTLVMAGIVYLIADYLLPAQLLQRFANLRNLVSGTSGMVQKFLLGMLNGFLPCGMVWAAGAMSIAQESPSFSALFMLVFWAATLPALTLTNLFGGWLLGLLPGVFKRRWVIPLLIIVAGILWARKSYVDPSLDPANEKGCPPVENTLITSE